MNELDKPFNLRDISQDPAEATVEVIRRLGPLTYFELKYSIGKKALKSVINSLVADDILYVYDTEPEVLYELTERRGIK